MASDQQKGIWIAGFFSQDKFVWYHIDDVGDNDFDDVKRISRKRLCSWAPRSSKGGLIIKPSSVKLKMFDSGSVALDCFIYTVGGCDPKGSSHIPRKYIYFLDTTNLDKGWKKLNVKMKMGRLGPDVAALEGKIYLFGGAVTSDSLPPSEVFDPVEGKIQALPDGYTEDLHLVGLDHVLKRIIFCSQHCITRKRFYSSKNEFSYLVFYNLEKQEWTKETHETLADHLFELISCTQVVVGTTIYWLSMSFHMKAYDFVQRKFYFSEELKNLSKEGHPGFLGDSSSSVCSFLIHMKGDCFSLFWDDDAYYSSKYSPLHCTRLRISNSCVTNSNLLNISVLGTQTYLIQGNGFKVTSILPM